MRFAAIQRRWGKKVCSFWSCSADQNWLRKEGVLFCAIIIGTLLRLVMITLQVPADDEWHSLNAISIADYGYIFTHFGLADHCIPLTLLYKAMADTIGLNEWTLRLPQLICGIAFVGVMPMIVRPYIGRLASEFLALMIAISPMLVYFSRYARPYSIAVFLGCLGVLSFFRWYIGQKKIWAVIYVICAILAPWFLLPIAPFVLSPLLLVFVPSGWKRNWTPKRRGVKEILILVGFVFAGLLLLLLPPLLIDGTAILGKVGRSSLEWGALVDMLRLYSGFSHPDLLIIWSVSAGFGMLFLYRLQPMFTIFLIFLICSQFGAVALSRATLLYHPIVAARYSLPILPLLIIFCACFLAKAVESVISHRSAAIGRWIGFAIIIFSLFLSPVPKIYGTTNSWTNHACYQYYPDYTNNPYYIFLVPKSTPSFYHLLSKSTPKSLTIVEIPFNFFWHQNNLPFYQNIHKQKIIAGVVNGYPPNVSFPDYSGFAFNTLVNVTDPESLIGSKAQYLVVHKNPKKECLGSPSWGTWNHQGWVKKCQAVFGSPIFQDQDILVFQLN